MTAPDPAFDPGRDPDELAAELIADDGLPWLTEASGEDPAPPEDRLAEEPADVTAEEQQ